MSMVFDHQSLSKNASTSRILCIPIQPSATRYASALGQSLRPSKMPRNWPIRQGPKLNYKGFSSLGCILVKALDWDAQQQQLKPTTGSPTTHHFSQKPKGWWSLAIVLQQARQNSIGHRSHGLRLLSNAEDPFVTAGEMIKITWMVEMGKIGSSKLLAFSLSSYKLIFLWCASMVVYLFEEGWCSCICIVKNDGSIFPIHLWVHLCMFYFRFDLGN